ncbi:MAG: ATP-binding protein [Comamonas sp. SCN 67-35]|uniref:amino acid ABC transporter ATP-binding protein n=1 Tax=unclassified Comamonas TaxID=2638500 RepID=UPI00086D0F70|nr:MULTISPECIES: amino acid ABC transporter ATP-binding protein [unclassified Comamonas]MBN9329503.1 amino acid ABC transporter ATP-binding protein [Comamonas sp.]ODU39706.1 MAG: ATP-binding protein [Comamonas sp. SCN 67-35]OJW96015.1 MAG: ATP-binding protein [Burkholderiales bacterium 66-26]
MIALQDIRKAFAGNEVLHAVSVQIAPGQVTALIGPSGSGKSTLLRCVNLLEIPDAGRLTLGQEEIRFTPGTRPSHEAVQRVRLQTGMVFQNFQLFAHQSAVQNVMEGLVTVKHWDKARAHARALALLEKVGLKDKADAWPANLSGGQQQRVAIARALAPEPAVLLCDEPTSALDPGLAAEVVAVLSDLAREGMTMLMATHDLRLAAQVASHTVFLQDGAVVEAGDSQAIFKNARDERTRAFVKTLASA